MSIFATAPLPTGWQSSWPGQGGFGRDLLEENPRSGWQFLLDHLLGLTNGQDPRSQFMQQQYDPWHNRYLGQVASRQDPNYAWTQFLQDYQPQIGSGYDNATPNQRGEHPGNFEGRLRYVGFPG